MTPKIHGKYTLTVHALSISEGFIVYRETFPSKNIYVLCFCGYPAPILLKVPEQIEVWTTKTRRSKTHLKKDPSLLTQKRVEISSVLNLRGPNLQKVGNFVSHIISLRSGHKPSYSRKGYFRVPFGVAKPDLPSLLKQIKI